MNSTYFKKIAELRGYTKRAADEFEVETDVTPTVDDGGAYTPKVDPTALPAINEDTNQRTLNGEAGPVFDAKARLDAAKERYHNAMGKVNAGTLKWGLGSSAASMAIYAAIQKLRGKSIRPGGIIGYGLGGFGVGSLGKGAYNFRKNPGLANEANSATKEYRDAYKAYSKVNEGK